MRLLITVLALALHCGTYGVSAAGNPPPANYAKQPITTKGPPKCTGANEVYTLCDNNSCLRDCSTFGRTDLACRPICTPGCICKPNHLRNSKGVCVKASQCDTNVCPAKNQIISDCASPCQEDCEHLGQNRTCSSLPCKIACVCKPGFYKNANGECVVPSKCDCGNNQVLDLCYNPCPPETCKTIGALFKCAVPATCKPACKCKLNYKRNTDGVCVDIRECPQPFPCKDVNTEYNACPGCVDERCNQSTPLACKDIVGELPCRPSCRCKSGFCKDDTGKCVKPAPKCTKPHEVYTECENNSCQRDCSTFGITDLACKPICTPGCICERNFLRNADGDCVKPEECGVDVCPEKNQQFSNCASPCAEDCMTMGKNITCNFLVCNIGCECKPGFFKNSKRECVAPEECDCGENQELDTCYNPCPPEKCEDIGKLFKCAVPDTCVSSCVCKRNFKRDLDGNCVYIGECPQPFICETTAHYDACPDCVDETCLQTDRILCVPEQWGRTCLPSCRCNDGLCRDPDLNCVDKVPYESCNGDPNAYFNKCGDPCPVTCNSLDLGLQCEDICSREGACKCKPGYVRHYDILGKCIPVEQCPKCGENEFFDCGSACDTVCGKIGVPCNIINKKCVEQCYCNEGFARDSKNVCIPVASCPATKPCNGDVNADPANGCKCKCGFALDAKGKCVAQKCSDINAEYVTCPNPCPGGTCLSPTFSPCKVACKPCGCQCKKGFVKKSSTDATCIALKSCPKY